MSLLYLVYYDEKSQLTETWEMQEICLWTTRLEQLEQSHASSLLDICACAALQGATKSFLEPSSQMCHLCSWIWRSVLVIIGKWYIFSKLCNLKLAILKLLIGNTKIFIFIYLLSCVSHPTLFTISHQSLSVPTWWVQLRFLSFLLSLAIAHP